MQKHVLINFPELQLKSKYCQGEGKMAVLEKSAFVKEKSLV